MRHAPLVALALALLTGCGHERATSGRAALWVTRDRGATVVLVRTVPAGLTAIEALDREADVDTRYGGRFVQSIEGIEGSVSQRRTTARPGLSPSATHPGGNGLPAR